METPPKKKSSPTCKETGLYTSVKVGIASRLADERDFVMRALACDSKTAKEVLQVLIANL